MGVDDPIQVFVAFVCPAGAALDGAEEAGAPVDSFVGTLGGLVALAVFYLRLFICCGFVVAAQNCLHCVVPETLRLPLALFFEWA